jgi:pre-mRNA-splicing factor ATP-dependent RNA helicase DHX16
MPSRRKRRYRTTSSDEEGHDDDDDQIGTGGIERYRRKAEARRQDRRDAKEEPKGENKNKNNAVSSRLTPAERAALEREKDLLERDEFVKRMIDRDQIKTKHGKEQEEEQQQQAAFETRLRAEERLTAGETIVDEATGTELNVDVLREQSRRSYLKKREERELELLKQSLQDEEDLFRGATLTEAEKKRVALGKQILRMVEDRDGVNQDKADDGFYRLPDEIDVNDTKAKQNEALLSSRYIEPKHEKSEQQLWEESQTQKAVALGSRKKAPKEDGTKYDLVFEDQIDFVMKETSKGYDRRKLDHRVKEEELQLVKIERQLTEHEKLLIGRKKLPVYTYREKFLAALKDHQVLILVGETGSGKT